MLVLSRQKDESIMIGDDVKITIVDVRGDKVRIGISAPKEIPVHRIEIYDAIQREKKEKTEHTKEPSDKTAAAQEDKAEEKPKKVARKKRSKKETEEQPKEQSQEQPASKHAE